MTRKTTKIDMHLHTRGSDGLSSAEEIAEAALSAGLDGLCITDHHKTHTAQGCRVADVCRQRGLLVFRGCEYSTAQGHLLVYGVDVGELDLGYYPAMLEVVAKVHDAAGFAAPSHPYHGVRKMLGNGLYDIADHIFAAETANGQVQLRAPDQNRQAKQAADELGLWGVGGSDAHWASMVGACYTVFSGQIRTEFDLVQALQAGQCRAVVNRKRVAENTFSTKKVLPHPMPSCTQASAFDDRGQPMQLLDYERSLLPPISAFETFDDIET